jgi:hypothetical protein
MKRCALCSRELGLVADEVNEKRIEVLAEVVAAALQQIQHHLLLDMSVHQVPRLLNRYKDGGGDHT